MTVTLEQRARAYALVTSAAPVAVAWESYQLRNPLNGSGGTTKGARYAANARRKRERALGAELARRLMGPYAGAGRFVVVLTRESPKPFDDDNLAASLKSVRDGMAWQWGMDDGDDSVVWLYDWCQGPTHVLKARLWVMPLVESLPEFDASDYERPRKPVISPAYIRAKGGL